MSKELELLEKIKQEFNCDPEYYGLGGTFEILESALQRLESIDNAEPSEALECLENLFSNVVSTTYNRESSLKDFNVIKQALLKQQELPEPFKTGVDIGVIKPKQYLKWEDLEFKEEEQWLKVKMGDNFYRIEWCNDDFGANVVSFYKYITKDYLVYCSCIKDNGKQFFDDLHLERVEE